MWMVEPTEEFHDQTVLYFQKNVSAFRSLVVPWLGILHLFDELGSDAPDHLWILALKKEAIDIHRYPSIIWCLEGEGDDGQPSS